MEIKPISAVIFDLDGVIIDSMKVMEFAYHSACEEVLKGQPYPPFSEYCRYLGRSLPEILRILDLPQEIRPAFIECSYQNIHRIPVYDGVGELLSVLWENKIPMAIATGKEYERTMTILRDKSIAHYFDMVLCSDKVPRPKPSPDMANIIIEKLNLTPENCVFVGDAAADMLCGKGAGTQTALAMWGKPDASALAESSDYRLKTPLDLLNHMELACYV
ncbi:HAD-IA family hydrolase [Hahella ganghwensis]|uniref:HAD-IA family hydrolase n=1 Tax=Hahella ganghwensis TaxID=286420 RepID=UPI00038033F5|nr:HAD-IA family hydrolase [Hahella ganghwensis]